MRRLLLNSPAELMGNLARGLRRAGFQPAMPASLPAFFFARRCSRPGGSLRSDLRQVSTRLELRLGNKNAGKDAGIAGWKPALRGLTLGCLALLLLAPVAMAQEQKKADEKPAAPLVQRLFVLKYADPNQIGDLIKVFTGNVTPNPSMHALAVSATPDAMTAIEDAIKRLDVPAAAPQNVELTFYLLVGGSESANQGTLPKDLDSVVAQLKNAFTYKSYRLLDVLTMRTRTGQPVSTNSAGGAVQFGNSSQPIITQFQIKSVSVGPEGAIRIDGLRASNRVPLATGINPVVSTQFTYQDIGINADLDIKEGQKVVVGKMSMNPNDAMFLVLTARVAQ